MCFLIPDRWSGFQADMSAHRARGSDDGRTVQACHPAEWHQGTVIVRGLCNSREVQTTCKDPRVENSDAAMLNAGLFAVSMVRRIWIAGRMVMRRGSLIRRDAVSPVRTTMICNRNT